MIRIYFFITTTCQSWLHLLTIGDSIQLLSDSLNFCSKKYDASILGYVFMPNHIHLIAHFPTSIHRIGFIRDFKSYTSKKVRQ
jgi:REP element-mobilizing transposase RayT